MKQRSRSFPAGLGFAGALLLAFLLTGCGYHFTVSGDSAYPAVRTVFVDVFTNRTSEAYAENIYRTAFINRFVQDGQSEFSFKNPAGNLSAQNRLSMTLELFFEERQSGRVLWSSSAFSAVGDYAVTTVGETETSRKNALIKLANDTAERASRLIMSGF